MEWWVESLPQAIQWTIPWMLYGTVVFIFLISIVSFGKTVVKIIRKDKSGLD